MNVCFIPTCDVIQVEKETAQSMQKLVELDSIKGRMHSSLEALQEADNWTTLSADVEEVFSSQDIAKVSPFYYQSSSVSLNAVDMCLFLTDS